MTVEEVSVLWEYIDKCAKTGSRAKLIFIAITSQVEGKIKSEGLPYGQGKSIFAAILAALIYHRYDAFLGLDIWEAVKDNFGYTWNHHKEAVKEAKLRRKRCDAIVLNGPENVGADRATVQLLTAAEGWSPPFQGSKRVVAERILRLVETLVARAARPVRPASQQVSEKKAPRAGSD